MKFKLWRHCFFIALRNAQRHSRRSFISVLFIAAAFCSVSLFLGYIENSENIFVVNYSQRMMYGKIILHHQEAYKNFIWEDGSHLISFSDQKTIEQMLRDLHVKNYVRFLGIGGMISNGRSQLIFTGLGYDPVAGAQMRKPLWEWNTLAGLPFSKEADATVDEVIVGQRLARLLGCLPEKRNYNIGPEGTYVAEDRPFHCETSQLQLTSTSPQGQLNAINVRVRGLMDALFTDLDVRYLVLPLIRAQYLMNTDGVSYYTIDINEDASDFAEALRTHIKSKNLPLKVSLWREPPFGEIYNSSMSFLNVFKFFTLIVVITVIILSTYSQFTRLIFDRVPEIGTLRTLGFTRLDVFILFGLEVLLLGACGILGGLLLTILIKWGFDHVLITYKIGILSENVRFGITLLIANLYLTALFLLGLVLVIGLTALYRPLKMKINECLTWTGGSHD